MTNLFLEALNRLRIAINSGNSESREYAAFIDWLRVEMGPRFAGLFVRGRAEGRFYLSGCNGLEELPKNRELSMDADPWMWFQDQGVNIPNGERFTLPIELRGELLGRLAYVSARRGKKLTEEQLLLNQALVCLVPVLSINQIMDVASREVVEYALRLVEERYRSLVEKMPIVMYLDEADEFGTSIYINPQVENLLGYWPSDFEKDPHLWQKIVVPEDLERALAAIAATLENDRAIDEYRVIARDGRIVWLRDTSVVVRDEAGKAMYIQGFIEDVTEQRRAEEESRTSESRFRALIANGLDYISLLDVGGKLLWESPSASNMLGYQYNEFIGRNLFELIHPDDQAWTKQYFAEMVAEPGSRRTGKFRMLRSDGSWLWAEAIASNFLREPSVGAIVINYRDVTERKQAEDSLRASEEKYRTFIEQMPAVVYVDTLDGKGTTIFVSPQVGELLGITVEEWLKSDLDTWADLLHPEDRRMALEEYKKLTQPGQEFDIECRIIRPDKRLVWIQDKGKVLRDSSGDLYLHGVMVDITERKLRERELQAEAMLAQALGETLELSPLLERLLDAARHAIPAADKGSVMLMEPDGGLRIHALSGYIDQRLKGITFFDGTGYAIRAARKKRPMLFSNVHADDALRYDGGIEDAQDINSAIVAPMLIQERLIGIISLDARDNDAFTGEDLRLLVKFATSAALIVDRSRLFDDTQKRLAELSVLHQSSQSLLVTGFDAEATYASLHEAVARVMPCDAFVIVVEDEADGDYHAVYRYDRGAQYPNDRVPRGAGLSGQVISQGKTLLVADYHEREDVQAVHFGDVEHVHSILAIPLKRSGRTFGMISAQSYEIGVYAESHREVLETIAAQFASSIETARLFEETQRRLRALELLQTVSAALRQAHTIEEMLPIFVKNAARAVGAQVGSIYLREASSGDWVSHGWVTAEGNWTPGTLELRHKPGEGVTGRVGERGEVYVIEDWRTDPMVMALAGEMDDLAGLYSGISLPFHAEHEVVGVMHIWYEKRHVISENEKHMLIAIADMAGNALQRARLHEETKLQLKRLTVLRDIDRIIASSFDLKNILNILLKHTTEQLNVDAANILLFNPHTQMLEHAAGHGFRSKLQSQLKLHLGESLAGRAAVERKVIAVPSLEAVKENISDSELLAGEEFKSYYAHPLITKGEIKGVMEIFHRAPLHVTLDWLNFFETLAGQAAIAIDNANLFEDLERSSLELIMAYDKTIEGWSKALDLRDRETEGHTRRVTDLTLKLAEQFDLSPTEIVHLRRGALLHDIGKIGIPDHILLKPGSLTEEEWFIMRQHPQFAYDMLASVEYLKPALDIPYCHHEKWDGSGYPRGLKGEQIPLAARIFAVADVWDALTSHRPYRLAWTKDQALEYIRSQTGKHFDPKAVEAFFKVVGK
ncbi:MAG: PAS domain-containing protein [Anaerolineales bacterium]|nr:PAS domain-containing protein [Anaerolineales bacterium]